MALEKLEKQKKLEKLEDLNRYITILIVDDKKAIRESIKEALAQEDYEEVWAVETAEEALEYLPRTNRCHA